MTPALHALTEIATEEKSAKLEQAADQLAVNNAVIGGKVFVMCLSCPGKIF